MKSGKSRDSKHVTMPLQLSSAKYAPEHILEHLRQRLSGSAASELIAKRFRSPTHICRWRLPLLCYQVVPQELSLLR